MDAGQFWALLTAVSVVALIIAQVGLDSNNLGEASVARAMNAVFGVLLLISLLACVWIASGISLSIST